MRRDKDMNREMKSHRLLTIDQGNSFAKACVWHGDSEVATRRLPSLSIEALLPFLEESGADSCVYCSVGHTDAKFLETLRRMLDGRLLVLTPVTPLPVGVSYDSRATLGADRVAAACGAVALYPGEGILVVDAGTAVTIDVVTPDGTFAGGNIAPGMRLRFSSLHEATSQLPLLDADGEICRFGHDTATAIRSGVAGGMVSEIADAYASARETYGCNRLLLTGNDAPVLLPLLRSRGMAAVEEPSLVGRGLLSIFRHNMQFDTPTI